MKKLIAVFFIFLLAVVTPALLYAQERTSSILTSDQTVEKVYFGHGDMVSVQGTVNDDAYLAGGTVDVDGVINGDLIAAGGTVTVSGDVREDVRVAGGTVNITGKVGGNVTVGGGTVTISDDAVIGGTVIAGAGTFNNRGSVGDDLYVGAGSAQLHNTVGGDVYAGVSDFTIGDKSRIAGNLTYTSDKHAVIADNSQVGGSVNFRRMEQDKESEGAGAAARTGAGAFLTGKLISHIFMFLIGLFFLYAFPVFTRQVETRVASHKLKNILNGFLLFIGVPFVALILTITLFGIPLAIILMLSYFLLLYISKIFVAMYLGRITLKKFSRTNSGAVILAVGLFLHFVFTILPVIGWLAGGIIMLWGAGAYLSAKTAVYKSLRTKKII